MRLIFGLMGLLISKIAVYGVTPIHKRPSRLHYIQKNAPFGAAYTLVASSDLISSKMRPELALRSMEIVTAPWSMISCLKIWMTLIQTRCGFNRMALRAIRRSQPSTYWNKNLAISRFREMDLSIGLHGRAIWHHSIISCGATWSHWFMLINQQQLTHWRPTLFVFFVTYGQQCSKKWPKLGRPECASSRTAAVAICPKSFSNVNATYWSLD